MILGTIPGKLLAARRKPTWLPIIYPVLVAIASPLLLFPRAHLPWIGLGLLALGWVVGNIASGSWLPNTPLDRPIVVLLLMTFVSLYPSVDLSLSMPKLYGILLGFAVFHAASSGVSNRRGFRRGVELVLVGMIGITLIGLVGTEWNTGKYPVLDRIYAHIPHLIRQIQTSFGPRAGIHPNEVGGTLAFLLPLPMALLVSSRVAFRGRLLLPRALLSAMILFGLGVLFLTGSRSALMGLAVATVALLIWRWRRVGLALLVATLVALGVVVGFNAPAVSGLVLKIDALSASPGANVVASREEVWQRAEYMIEDFPFTGIGLNTFPVILDTLYPSFLAGPDAHIPHAHDIYLQTAVDLGLGGLLAFLGLWASIAYIGWRGYCRAAPSIQPALIGLLLGILAYLVYGLTDAITLGAKPLVLLWLMIGLIVAADRLSQRPSGVVGEPLAPATPAPTAFFYRAASLFIRTVADIYWMITYFLVFMGIVVVVLGITGWTP